MGLVPGGQEMSFIRPPRVAATDATRGMDAPGVFLRHLPGGPNLALVGTAALIWSVAVSGAGDVAREVAEAVGEDVEAIRADVEEYLAELIDQGLLVHHRGRPS